MFKSLRRSFRRLLSGTASGGPGPAPRPAPVHTGEAQALDVYWDPEFAKILDTWGEGTVWLEIQYLLTGLKGRVLDVACGTGRAIQIVSRFEDLEVHGCDISDLLIGKAREKGIPAERLKVCDAVRTGYPDGAFEASYSIGSLEHFSDTGIGEFLREGRRITKTRAFHLIPISRTGRDEGWIRDGHQEYFNNGEDWWLPRFRAAFPRVRVLASRWESATSVGRWFVCDTSP
jgi:ubiquinone/menaquinone biosynthesis C-methylase UbiE